MAKRTEAERWSLAELAEECGVPPRTIRYYIARGLMDGPAVAGRGAEYTEKHLERLRTIQQLQSRGAMLADIARILTASPEAEVLPEPEVWHRYVLANDVCVWVRNTTTPWRIKRVRSALAEFKSRITGEQDDERRN
jgi:DNA-binding transcriptional MerR regulator